MNQHDRRRCGSATFDQNCGGLSQPRNRWNLLMFQMWGSWGVWCGMDDTERHSPDYYREKAADQGTRMASRFPDVIRDLLATADRFDCMAAIVEKWCWQAAEI